MLDEQTELFAIGLIFESPTMYLQEVCQAIQDLTFIQVSPATICRLLHRYGITRKKVKQAALQRCYQLRGALWHSALCFLGNNSCG